MNKEQISHPAQAMVSFSRASVGGAGMALFGSELRHSEIITLRVKAAVVERDLGREWYHGKETICEVDFSPVQFASLLTLMNFGDGVPATFTFRADLPPAERGVKYPGHEATREIFDREMLEDARKIVTAMDRLDEEIAAMKLTQAQRKRLTELTGAARRGIMSSLPFLVKSFKEKMDGVVADAKAGVEAFITGVVQRTGLETLRAKAPQLAPPGPDSPADAIPAPSGPVDAPWGPLDEDLGPIEYHADPAAPLDAEGDCYAVLLSGDGQLYGFVYGDQGIDATLDHMPETTVFARVESPLDRDLGAPYAWIGKSASCMCPPCRRYRINKAALVGSELPHYEVASRDMLVTHAKHGAFGNAQPYTPGKE